MNTVNSFFDKVFVINLDRRLDRLEAISARLKELGIEFERVKAAEGGDDRRSAISACAQSHYNVIDLSIKRGYRNILVLEDDALFVDGFLEKFNYISSTIPDDWDMIYFGALSICKDKDYGLFSKVSYCTCCHAVGIKSTMFDKLLDANDLISDVDVRYASVMDSSNVYALDPSLIIQAPGKSDISGYDYDFPSLFRY